MRISCSATSSSLFREEEAQRKKKNLVAFAIAKYMICNWTGEQLATHISASSEPLRKIVAVVALFYLQREGEGRGKRREVDHLAAWHYYPSACSGDRILPPINRDEGQAAFAPSLSTRLRHALLPVNKLYHGSTAGRRRCGSLIRF